MRLWARAAIPAECGSTKCWAKREIKDIKAQGLEDADASDLGERNGHSRESTSLAALRYRA